MTRLYHNPVTRQTCHKRENESSVTNATKKRHRVTIVSQSLASVTCNTVRRMLISLTKRARALLFSSPSCVRNCCWYSICRCWCSILVICGGRVILLGIQRDVLRHVARTCLRHIVYLDRYIFHKKNNDNDFVYSYMYIPLKFSNLSSFISIFRLLVYTLARRPGSINSMC